MSLLYTAAHHSLHRRLPAISKCFAHRGPFGIPGDGVIRYSSSSVRWLFMGHILVPFFWLSDEKVVLSEMVKRAWRVQGGAVEEIWTAPTSGIQSTQAPYSASQPPKMAPGTPRTELKLCLKETSFHRGRPRYVLTRSIDPGPSFTGDAEHQVRRHCQWVIHPNVMRDTRWRWNRERVPAWGGGDDTQRGGWTIKVEVRTTKEKCEAKTGKSSLPPHRLGLRRNQPLSLPSHSSRPKRNAYAKKPF